MKDRDVQLAGLWRSTADAAGRALQWIGDNADQVRQEQPSLLREFRKFQNAASKLAAAVERPMCVGVFGASQAGKSYLITAFASREGRALIADFDGVAGGLDFVRQMNPEGGGESTGLVTRFSLRKVATLPGFPVALQLLSQSDIVKILGNTFFSDGDLSDEPDLAAAQIAALAEQARKAPSADAPSGLTEDDVWDIQEYFERQFKGEPIIRSMSSAGYWSALAECAPRASLAKRAKLFAPLWGEIEDFSALFLRLVDALDQLGHARSAFAEIEALVERTPDGYGRRADSVINVDIVKNELHKASADGLTVRSAAGFKASVTRPSLAALIAELHLTIHEKPWDLLEHTDLLDFPGARSRRKLLLRPALRSEPRLPGELFLRGKVAYLFECYNAEQELTSMMLCVGPSNQEVQTLPNMVKDWIDATHGAEASERTHAKTALFFVLTKFDLEFEEKVGEDPDSTARWTRRLNNSLLGFFGAAHRWPSEWTPGRPFDNCFWLRNPGANAEHLIDYEDMREIAVLPRKANKIAKFRVEFLANDLARRHFHDPERAWDEAFRLNDGGVTYLAESIAPVCNPLIKTSQIAARVDHLRRTMGERLKRYFVTDDLAERREQRLAAARDVIRQLLRCASDQKFGGLMRALQTSDIDLGDVFFNLATSRDQRLPQGARIDTDKLGQTLGIETTGEDLGALDVSDYLARAALAHWVDQIRSLANTSRICVHFKISEGSMSDLVDELIAGSLRHDVRGQVADAIRPAMTPHASLRERTVKPAMLAADAIGAFVYRLGYDQMELGKRPMRRGSSDTRVFAPRPSTDFPQLEERPSSFDQKFYSDWFSAYLDLVAKNAESVAGQTINVEQNDRLGAVVKGLAAAAAVA